MLIISRILSQEILIGSPKPAREERHLENRSSIIICCCLHRSDADIVIDRAVLILAAELNTMLRTRYMPRKTDQQCIESCETGKTKEHEVVSWSKGQKKGS
jgi:hypothetical protein